MKRNKWLVNSIKIISSLILLGILFNKFNFYEFLQMANQLSGTVILVTILIYLFSVFINAYKWKIILIQYPLKELVKVCYKAQFFSVVLPGQLFGEAYKVGGIEKSNTSKEEIASSVIMDKVTGLLGTAVVGFSGILFCSLKIPFSIILCFFLVFLLLILILGTSRISIFYKIVNYITVKFKNHKYTLFRIIAKSIDKLYFAWIDFLDKPSVLLKSILIGILNQYLGIVQVFILARSLNISVGYMDCCWIMAGVSIILLVPVSFAGIGLREVSLVGFLSLYGVSPETSMILSVALLISQIVSALVGGIIIVSEGFMRENNE